MNSLKQKYQQAIDHGQVLKDPSQLAALKVLEKLKLALEHPEPPSWKFWSSRLIPRSVYLEGPVGRGKTYVMDLFYENTDCPKLRMHFYAFMQSIQEKIASLQGHKNPLEHIVKELCQQVRLICLDEFLVVNIVDAMILAQLLKGLFAAGIILVTTSNLPPTELYQYGLQRESFLPAIDLLQQHCDLVHVDCGQDYRLLHLQQGTGFLYPESTSLIKDFQAHFEKLPSVKFDTLITLAHREVPVKAISDQAIWFDFLILCSRGRSQMDYLELAERYSTIVISGVRAIGPEENDLITNFIRMIDIFYDHHLHLIISASIPMQNLYPQGREQAAFERCKSRLVEMSHLRS